MSDEFYKKMASTFRGLSKNLLQSHLQKRFKSNQSTSDLNSASTKQFSQVKPPSLSDKVALITGAAEGIGFALAKVFLRNKIGGLVLSDINNDKGIESTSELTCEFGEERIVFLEADVCQSKQVDWLYKKTIQNFERVDIVVNNAGIMNDVNWENQIATNLQGTVVGTLLGMQYMSKTCFGHGGTIINVASIMGLIPSTGYPVHTMTQYGLIGFSRAIGNTSHYERTGVKVLALCPGLTNTRLLKQAPYYAINDKFRKEFKEESSGCMLQKPESVGLAALEILDKAEPGSVWVVENNNRPYEIKFPEVADMRFKQKQKC